MPLSYNRAIIKSNASIKEGSRIIETEEESKFINGKTNEITFSSYEEESYIRLRESIINKAKESSEEILKKAYLEAEEIKKRAYEKGYSEGEKNGYEDGYKESYEVNIEKANKEAGEIIEQSEKLLFTAKEAYEDYLRSKEGEIINLSLEIAKNLISEKLTEREGLNNLVKEAIAATRNIKNLIIKANSFHCDALKKEILEYKEISLKAEIFVIEDNNLEKGNVEIITDKGKIKTGIQIAIEKINEIF